MWQQVWLKCASETNKVKEIQNNDGGDSKCEEGKKKRQHEGLEPTYMVLVTKSLRDQGYLYVR